MEGWVWLIMDYVSTLIRPALVYRRQKSLPRYFARSGDIVNIHEKILYPI